VLHRRAAEAVDWIGNRQPCLALHASHDKHVIRTLAINQSNLRERGGKKPGSPRHDRARLRSFERRKGRGGATDVKQTG
jgi:hypothetical protein